MDISCDISTQAPGSRFRVRIGVGVRVRFRYIGSELVLKSAQRAGGSQIMDNIINTSYKQLKHNYSHY